MLMSCVKSDFLGSSSKSSSASNGRQDLATMVIKLYSAFLKSLDLGPTLLILGMRMHIFCLAPASQCVNTPTEAARAHALLTAREARLPTNLRTRRKLYFLRMAKVTFLSVTNWYVRTYAYRENTTLIVASR